MATDSEKTPIAMFSGGFSEVDDDVFLGLATPGGCQELDTNCSVRPAALRRQAAVSRGKHTRTDHCYGTLEFQSQIRRNNLLGLIPGRL